MLSAHWPLSPYWAYTRGMIATQTEVTELSEITIRRISVSEMDNNVYLL